MHRHRHVRGSLGTGVHPAAPRERREQALLSIASFQAAQAPARAWHSRVAVAVAIVIGAR
ncbi:hypothetical protein DB30_04568 [Enhygromyxa salina]|uniref:Uncharacterized protein n=1 Tax=Enhygromyxa salina TaxID=215803 RepID=A0A0C2A6S9_9BACT|nr:hypothetical protein DB30_04568 [Enhygromyxa salina]